MLAENLTYLILFRIYRYIKGNWFSLFFGNGSLNSNFYIKKKMGDLQRGLNFFDMERLLGMCFLVFSMVGSTISLCGQCDSPFDRHQSPKIANYEIEVLLDTKAKKITCHQKLIWKNTSPDTIDELRFYMYMNAFQDTLSTYLKNAHRVFLQDISHRKENEWGSIVITKMTDESQNPLHKDQHYIRPDDANLNDYTILSVPLKHPILPGKTGVYDIDFETKMPKTISRSGYSKNDFFLFVHWFPQVCVYEPDEKGDWGWNSHQFMRRTEFFADFGDYKVTINAPKHLVIGGSGCRVKNETIADRQIVTFEAYDLIDFGWVVYPDFDTYTYRVGNTDVEILMPPEHCAFASRYLEAITMALEYMEKHVGEYPYPKITVVDPPVHALNSGFMEYPMMITGASFYGIPRCVRSVESLVVHEFLHMYFMATIATNEKERPWMDEGFVTYYEDRVTDDYYGPKRSFYNILGFHSGNGENSRLEYVDLPNPSVGTIARPGWEIKESYKGLVYAKTATVLKTLENIIGQPIMDKIMQSYYEKYKFAHPREKDLRQVMRSVLSNEKFDFDFDIDEYLDQCLHGTEVCDFAVGKYYAKDGIHHMVLKNKGNLHIPVEWKCTFVDGHVVSGMWDGSGKKEITIEYDVELQKIEVDPEHKIYLDIDFNNNGRDLHPNKLPLVKYATKTTNWMQTIFNVGSFLF